MSNRTLPCKHKGDDLRDADGRAVTVEVSEGLG